MNSIADLRISDIMSPQVLGVAPESALSAAARLMSDNSVSCALVLEDGRPVGMLTERDVVRLLHGKISPEVHVAQVMSGPVLAVSPELDFHAACNILRGSGVRHLVAVDGQGVACGVVTESDFQSRLGIDVLQRTFDLRAVMDVDLPSLSPDRTVADALALMLDGQHDYVIVVRDEQPLGILTERDLPRLLAQQVDCATVALGDVMSAPLHTISTSMSSPQAALAMSAGGTRHLVVVDDGGRIAGVLTQHRMLTHLGFDSVEQAWREREATQAHSRDLDLQLQAVLEAADLAGIFDALDDYVFIISMDGCILDCNAAVENGLGYGRAIIGKSAWSIHPEAVWPQVQRHFIDILAGKQAGCQFPIVRADGTQIVVDERIVRGSWRGKPAVFAVARDVTETSEAEKRIAQMHAQSVRALRLHEALLKAIPIPVFFKDRNGRYIGCNPAFERALGVTAADIFGKSVGELWPSEMAHVYERMDLALMESPGRQSYESEVVNAAGEVRQVLFEKNVFLDENDEAAGIVGAFIDITEMRQVERQLRELSLVVAQSPSSIVITDLDANIEYVNDAFVRASGYLPEEVLGENPRILSSDRTPRETYDRLWAALTAGKPWQGELINKRKNGEIYIEFAHISPIRQPDGRVTHYLAIKEDITERRRLESELSRHRHHLEDLITERTLALEFENRVRRSAEEEVKRLNSELSQRAHELEIYVRELESFNYTVSHDLRAPLRAINGFARLLAEAEGARLGGESRDMLERIVANTRKMGDLIDNILEYSRIGRVHMERSPVNLQQLAASVAEEMRPDYPNAQILLEALPTVHADATMMRQVYANLIGNALKFSSNQPAARVEIGFRQEDGGGEFFVHDNGAGFDMRYAEKLFGMFQRLHREAEFPGTGVGLAIVKCLIERHGGRIWADARPGEGATFTFTLGD